MHGERLLEGFSGNGMIQGRLGTVGSLDEIELLEIFGCFLFKKTLKFQRKFECNQQKPI